MTPEERRQILEMVATGKISADEASSLLQATSSSPAEPAAPAAPVVSEKTIPVEEELPVAKKASAPDGSGRWLHIHINDLKSGERRVSVNLPLGWVRAGLTLAGRDASTWDRMSRALLDDQDGMIVEVKDEEDGEHVQIFVD